MSAQATVRLDTPVKQKLMYMQGSMLLILGVLEMPQNISGVVHQGRIETSEPIVFPEGSKVLVTLVTNEEADFWDATSGQSLKAVWDNPEDDVYAQLLEK